MYFVKIRIRLYFLLKIDYLPNKYIILLTNLNQIRIFYPMISKYQPKQVLVVTLS